MGHYEKGYELFKSQNFQTAYFEFKAAPKKIT